MIKKTYVNGIYTNRRKSNLEEDTNFLLNKNIEFRRTGKTIKFTNPKGQDIIWTYEVERFKID